jgi:hypothetical protein
MIFIVLSRQFLRDAFARKYARWTLCRTGIANPIKIVG